MFSHFQGAVTKDFLQSKGVAATVQKELASESVPDCMCTGHPDSSFLIVFPNGFTDGSRREEITVLIAEQIVLWLPSAYRHILPQHAHHLITERNDLDLSAFGVAVQYLFLV